MADEQKLNIATYFLMSSPTGEVDDVTADVVKLVDDNSTLSDSAINSILKDYNTENLVYAADPETGANVMVSAHGLVADDQFLDPNTGRVLKFDHRKRVFTEVTDKKQVLSDEVAKFRSAVQKSVEGYVAGQYKQSKVCTAVYGHDNGSLTICISAKNINLGNYWTGGWRSVYTISTAAGAQELKGNVKVQVHYFEDGNVQLHSNFDKTASINVSNEDSTAKEIAKAISKIETEFQSNLEEMYVTMHSHTFKAMRRFLPISRQPMTWNSAAHGVAGEVGTR